MATRQHRPSQADAIPAEALADETVLLDAALSAWQRLSLEEEEQQEEQRDGRVSEGKMEAPDDAPRGIAAKSTSSGTTRSTTPEHIAQLRVIGVLAEGLGKRVPRCDAPPAASSGTSPFSPATTTAASPQERQRVLDLIRQLVRLQDQADEAYARCAAAIQFHVRTPETPSTVDAALAGEIASVQSSILRSATALQEWRRLNPPPELPSASTGQYGGFGSEDMVVLDQWQRNSSGPSPVPSSDGKSNAGASQIAGAAAAASDDCSDAATTATAAHIARLEEEIEAGAARRKVLDDAAAARAFSGRSLDTVFRTNYGQLCKSESRSDAAEKALARMGRVSCGAAAGPSVPLLSCRVFSRTFCAELLRVVDASCDGGKAVGTIDLAAALGFDCFLQASAVYLSPLLKRLAPNTAESVLAGNAENAFRGVRIFLESTQPRGDSSGYQTLGPAPGRGLYSSHPAEQYTRLGDRRNEAVERGVLRVRVQMRTLRSRVLSRVWNMFSPESSGQAHFTVHRELHSDTAAAHQQQQPKPCDSCTNICCSARREQLEGFGPGDILQELVMDFEPVCVFEHFGQLPREIQEHVMSFGDAFDGARVEVVTRTPGFKGIRFESQLWSQYLQREFGVDMSHRDARTNTHVCSLDTAAQLEAVDASALRLLLQQQCKLDSQPCPHNGMVAGGATAGAGGSVVAARRSHADPRVFYLLLLAASRRRDAKSRLNMSSDIHKQLEDILADIRDLDGMDLLLDSSDLLDGRAALFKAQRQQRQCAIM